VPVVTDPIAGLRRAAREVGLTTRLYWKSSYEAAALDSDLVIVGATPFLERVAELARKYPRTRWLVGESVRAEHSPYRGLANVTGLVFDDRELGYLTGYLAGLMAKPRGTVSAVGGLPVPSVLDLIAGFRRGVRLAHRGVRVLVGYSMSFDTQSACEHLANWEISHGSTIVFDVAGACGFGAMQAAAIRGVWGIGVDTDLSYLGRQILASAVKRLDRATELAATLFADGALPAGGDVRLDLATDSTGLAGISEAVPASVRAKVEALASRLRARDAARPR
jgi:basic membrane protein A